MFLHKHAKKWLLCDPKRRGLTTKKSCGGNYPGKRVMTSSMKGPDDSDAGGNLM